MTALRQLAEKVKDEMLKDPNSPFRPQRKVNSVMAKAIRLREFTHCSACGTKLRFITFCTNRLVGCPHCHWYADAE